jgi:predicted O-methyltransferase YrrM
MPEFKFSQDWFSQHIPQWKKNLAKFIDQPNLTFLEIGTFEGRAAVWLLQNVLTHSTSFIDCIDNWSFQAQGLKLDPSLMESNFDHNIAALGRPNAVQKMSGDSQDILRKLPTTAYDFIYIDGAHNAAAVLEDAVLSWGLLRAGGIMTFDDYQWSLAPQLLDRPKLAIDAFLSVFQGKYKLLDKQSQVTIEKIK